MHHISKDLQKIEIRLLPFFLAAMFIPIPSYAALKNINIDDFIAKPPVHVLGTKTTVPKGMIPEQIKAAYHLPKTGGSGTIAIVTAYDSKTLEADIAGFTSKFNLSPCTIANGCLEKHPMSKTIKQSSGWALETALDTEWAHATAPDAKILVIESVSDSGPNLMKAVDYARSRPDVVSVSMSWGGKEFKDEVKSDSHFTDDPKNKNNIAFFAASGDDGTGASWPAASPNVVAVGGTTLSLDKNNNLNSEKAWSGSGGGISTYEDEPGFQKSYSIAKASGKRAIPDVAFNADPKSGYSVYYSKNWYVVGGTSAGAPQWAAIKALDDGKNPALASSTVSFITKLYEDKARVDHAQFFRDITSGKNGDCTYYCDARKHYDYVTGIGTPLTYKF